MKIRPVGTSSCIRTEGQKVGQTHLMKLIVAFRNIAIASKDRYNE